LKPRSISIAAVLAALPSLACAPVPGEGSYVHIASEEAIIIWDAPSKTQHFIRRASFSTDGKDFGFLVPTPAKPELAESSDGAFDALAKITAAQVIRADPTAKSVAKAAALPKPEVVLLERKMVAGFDAAVLEATAAGALDGWLKKNGYPSSPELVEWYKPYIAAGWKITAFKIPAESQRVSTAAVRMSFPTDKPFFPYREPATQRRAGPEGAERLLRVYFLGDARFEGTIGEKTAWPGKAVWSDRIESAQHEELLRLANLPAATASGSLWLTEFEDRSSPRPGTDEVFFTRTEKQTTLARPPVTIHDGPSTLYLIVALAIVLLMVLAVVYVLWRIVRWLSG
jgi:Uncharacterized protein conserved in bacteria (DUF2330)